jgi:sialic acid synthase SpsE
MEGEDMYTSTMTRDHLDLKLQIFGEAFYPFKHTLVHSCVPNTLMQSVFDKNVVIVCKPIKKGEKISRGDFRSYESNPLWFQKNFIESMFGTSCKCDACTEKWSLRDQLPAVDPKFNYPEFKTFPSHEQAKANIARNNIYVNRYTKKGKPTKEACITIYNNQFELETLSRPPFYP